MKTLFFLSILICSSQCFAQNQNRKLAFKKFVIEYDSICNAADKGCYASTGQVIITNDSIEYNDVKYYMTKKYSKDGIEFHATSVKSEMHEIVISGDYLINGMIKMKFIVNKTISTFFFPISSIESDGRSFRKTYTKE